MRQICTLEFVRFVPCVGASRRPCRAHIGAKNRGQRASAVCRSSRHASSVSPAQVAARRRPLGSPNVWPLASPVRRASGMHSGSSRHCCVLRVDAEAGSRLPIGGGLHAGPRDPLAHIVVGPLARVGAAGCEVSGQRECLPAASLAACSELRAQAPSCAARPQMAPPVSGAAPSHSVTGWLSSRCIGVV